MATPTKSNLDLVTINDNFPYDDNPKKYYRLYLPHDDRPHGWMLPDNVNRMPWTDDFQVDHQNQTVHVKDKSNGKDASTSCNNAFANLVNITIEKDIFDTLHGRHSEPFKIVGARYPVHIERFASSLFGIIHRGAHLTAYTILPNGMKIWVPRRSSQLFTYPNKLDTTVAGGVVAHETPFETIVHESDEEASLPADLVKKDARAVGCLTYMSLEAGGKGDQLIFPDCVFVYDMEVPTDVKPVPKDDEVKEFTLMSVDEVKAALAADEFKDNSAVVMLDFFIRHGIISHENEPDYVEMITRMHRRLPFPTSSDAV